MTLGKSIQLLTTHAASLEIDKAPDLKTAIQLLIEAGKRLDHCQRWSNSTWGSPLPGETKG